jgi:hypothetical protein
VPTDSRELLNAAQLAGGGVRLGFAVMQLSHNCFALASSARNDQFLCTPHWLDIEAAAGRPASIHHLDNVTRGGNLIR